MIVWVSRKRARTKKRVFGAAMLVAKRGGRGMGSFLG